MNHRQFNRILLGLSWLGLWRAVEKVPIDDWKFLISLMITVLSLYLEYLNRKTTVKLRNTRILSEDEEEKT